MSILYEDEPTTGWDQRELDRLIWWADNQGASDLYLTSGQPAGVENDGEWHRITQQVLKKDDLETLINRTKQSQSATMSIGGDTGYMDYGYEAAHPDDPNRSIRLRVNAVACQDPNAQQGYGMVLRLLPAEPPLIENWDLPDELRDLLFFRDGLGLVTGRQGSGKSTLLAGVLYWIARNHPRFVSTFEKPIEFQLDKSPSDDESLQGFVRQHEVPRDIPRFADAPPAVLRMASKVTLIGESRNQETMKKVSELAEAGVATYTTLHARSVPDTPSRMVNIFPQDERNEMKASLISSCQFILHQKLVPDQKGGRVAVREWLDLDQNMRRDLKTTSVEQLIPAFEEMLESEGHPLRMDVQKRYENGRISEDTVQTLLEKREASQ